MTLLLLSFLYLLYNVCYALTSLPAGKLADRYGKKSVLIASYFLFALLTWGFAKEATPSLLWILFALYGVFMGMNDGVARAYISDTVPDRQRGSALGMYNMLTALLILPANALGGYLWYSFGVTIPFLLAAVVASIAGLLLLWTKVNGK